MNLELSRASQSNIDVSLKLTADVISQYQDKSLKSLQKTYKAPWFREWNVPLDIIKKQMDQEYIRANGIEMAVNESIDKLIKENSAEYQFIWDIYNLSILPEWDDIVIKYTVDIYPSAKKLNDNFKSVKIEKADDEPTKEDIESSFNNLIAQYGEWTDADEITEDSSARAKIKFIDSEGNILEESRVFVNWADIAEHDIVKKNFLGKKMNEEFDMKYDHDKLPHILHYHKDGQNPAKVEVTIDAIQNLIKPEINEENIKKRFGNEDIRNEEELKTKIAEVIKLEKGAMNLTNAVEKYLEEAGPSFECIVPKTMVQYEFNTRVENMSKRFGSKEKMEKYLEVANEKNPEWKLSDYYAEIEKSAWLSINKFFIFREITRELGIESEINWDKELDPETKLYEFLSNNK